MQERRLLPSRPPGKDQNARPSHVSSFQDTRDGTGPASASATPVRTDQLQSGRLRAEKSIKSGACGHVLVFTYTAGQSDAVYPVTEATGSEILTKEADTERRTAEVAPKDVKLGGGG